MTTPVRGASSTALLIARSLLLAEAAPPFEKLLAGDTAALTRQLLDATGAEPWFDFALRHACTRSMLFAIERALLPGIILHWLVRKLLIESHARDAIAAGCRQIVVLGAGFDTLARRLHGVANCFEIDRPMTQAIKRRAFGEAPNFLAADLLSASVAEALAQDPRYSPDQPTLFIAEGLLMYLPADHVGKLFRELASFGANRCRFVFTFMEERPGKPLAFHNASRVVGWWLGARGEPFRWGVARAEAHAFVRNHGWHLAAMSSPEELRSRFLNSHGLAGEPLAIGESIALAYLGD